MSTSPAVAITALIFGVTAFVSIVILYVFYFLRFQHTCDSRPSAPENIVVQASTTPEERDLDLDDPPLLFDGVVLSADDWVLVRHQTDRRLNGVYRVDHQSHDHPGHSSLRLRRLGLREGALVYVRRGTAAAGQTWRLLLEGVDAGQGRSCLDVDTRVNFVACH
jgi:hypothetical protein